MSGTRKLLWVTLGMGVLSAFSFILGRLAMTDIFHGEPNLDLEWTVVSVTFLPVALFHLLAVVALVLALRRLRDPEPR